MTKMEVRQLDYESVCAGLHGSVMWVFKLVVRPSRLNGRRGSRGGGRIFRMV